MNLLSVRNVITLLFAVLIFSTAAVTLGLTLSFSMSAINNIGVLHAEALASKVKSQIDGFLTQPLGQLRGLQSTTMIINTTLPSENPKEDWYHDEFRRLFSDMVAVHFAYQFAVIGYDDGNYVGCKRDTVPNVVLCRAFLWKGREKRGKSLVVEEYYNVTTMTVINTKAGGTTTYDPRTRVWYDLVRHIPFENTWSQVYLSAMPTVPIVDVNSAVFNSSGRLIGIAGYTYELQSMSNAFLPGLRTTKNSYCVIVDNQGLLMATTYHEPFLSETEIPLNYNGTIPSECVVSDALNNASRSIILCRRSITNYGWRELRELNEAMAISNVVAFTDRVKLSTGYHFVSIVKIEPSLNASNMAWRFVLITPEDDILGEVYRGRDWALVSTALVFVLSVGIAATTTTVLFRPLNRIAERMYRTACLQDDDDDELPSVLHEVSVIQNAYSIMKGELDKLKSFVPMSVLAGGADDEDNESEDCSLIPADKPTITARSPRIDGSPRRNADASPVSSKNGSNKSSKSCFGKGAPPSALHLGLKLATKRVTVLAVNILMFHAATKALKENVGSMHATVTVALLEAVRVAKGIMEHFHGDRFTVTFNAASSVSAHAKAACRAVLAIVAIEKNFADKEMFSPPVRFTMGVMSGLATVGNMGGGDVRRHSIVGSVFRDATLLERLCKMYGEQALVGNAVVTDSTDAYRFQFIDVIRVLSEDHISRTRLRIAAVRSVIAETDNDEWMYQLQAAEAANPYSGSNAAFQAFFEGKAEEAATALGAITKAPIALHLRELIETGDDGKGYSAALKGFYSACYLDEKSVAVLG